LKNATDTRVLAYITLFAWSFLAATLLPVGSEAAVLLLVRQNYSLSTIVTVATLGNYFGACTTYWIAARAARHIGVASHNNRAARLVARYGQPALLLSWVPIIGDAIVAAAGVAQMPFWSFSAFTIAGKFLRYAVLVWSADTYWNLDDGS
jgi:membrane protein YqaA with SNARE-associated domain